MAFITGSELYNLNRIAIGPSGSSALIAKFDGGLRRARLCKFGDKCGVGTPSDARSPGPGGAGLRRRRQRREAPRPAPPAAAPASQTCAVAHGRAAAATWRPSLPAATPAAACGRGTPDMTYTPGD